jgi:hypothetical protein
MGRHLEISMKRSDSSKVEALDLGPPAGQPEGIAAIAVWLMQPMNKEHQAATFSASQIDSCRTASLENVLRNGSLKPGDSIEVTVKADRGLTGDRDDATSSITDGGPAPSRRA